MLVWRRAASTRGLLFAAAVAAVIAVLLLTGLTQYAVGVLGAGSRSAVAAAPVDERSVLVRGPAGSHDEYTELTTALSDWFADGFGGTSVDVAGSIAATGRQLIGDTANAEPDSEGLVFAKVITLDDVRAHAELTSGAWPAPGKSPAETAVGAAAAEVLGLRIGDRVPIGDRRTEERTEIVVSGIFEGAADADPYWRMVPELAEGNIEGGATYGPFVLDQADFHGGGWAASGTGAWVAEPDLRGSELTQLREVRTAARTIDEELPADTGLASAASVQTGLVELIDRVERADLVGRSTLLTPLLLLALLGGYALVLLAGLLTEQRREETALLRARGASRLQLAGLSLRESLLVVLPAVLIAPPAALVLVGLAERIPLLREVGIRLDGRPSALLWLVTAVAAVGCAVAMVLPALKMGRTYVADVSSRSRPSRGAALQRGGLDVALVGLAALAWYQLRIYSSPVLGSDGGLGIDPFLAAAAPIGVLAGAVVALRLLPVLTGLAERLIDRRSWFATQIGVWQAGRRPHAGPVLLLSLAVAVSTLAWTLAASSERSASDQATYAAGADLRLVERSGFAPDGRTASLAGITGVRVAAPAWHSTASLGDDTLRTDVLAISADSVPDVFHLREDLGDPADIAEPLAEGRVATGLPLPHGDMLTATVTVANIGEAYEDVPPPVGGPVFLDFWIMDLSGSVYWRGAEEFPADGEPRTVSVDLGGISSGSRLLGWQITGASVYGAATEWSVGGLQVSGTPLPLTDTDWATSPGSGSVVGPASRTGAVTGVQPDSGTYWRGAFRIPVVAGSSGDPVPAVLTSAAATALRVGEGDTTVVPLGPARVELTVAEVVDRLPATTHASAILVDLSTVNAALVLGSGRVLPTSEWWLDLDSGAQDEALAATAELDGLDVVHPGTLERASAADPFGVGSRVALFIAAFGAIGLALVGIAVDVRATARRRLTELAVLNTLGARARTLAAALVLEQGFLAGLGVLVGMLVGWSVATVTAPLVILTPSAQRPVPEVLAVVDWFPVVSTALVLLLVAMVLAGTIALTMRRRLAAAQLRIGDGR